MMKTNCKDTLKDVLSNKRDNSSTAEHLAACQHCNKAAEEWDTLKDLKGYPFEEPPTPLDTAIRRAASDFAVSRNHWLFHLSGASWRRISLVTTAAACWVIISWIALPYWKTAEKITEAPLGWSSVSMDNELFTLAVSLELNESHAKTQKEQDSKDAFEIEVPELL